MIGLSAVPLVDAVGAGLPPMQTLGLDRLLGTPAPARAVGAFVLVSAVGGLLRWRYEPFLDRSIEASMSKPVRAIVYGIAAHAVLAFAGVYLASQLAQSGIFGTNGTLVAGILGGLALLLVGSLGFMVVGSILATLSGSWSPWVGVAAGGTIAGVAGLLGPTSGGLLWFVVVSMGIGGPARRWLHADAVDDL